MKLLAYPPIRSLAIRAIVLKERVTAGAVFDPLDESFRRNPYPSYRRLQTRDPVHWSGLTRGWVLTRYADVMDVLRDPTFSANRSQADVVQELRGQQPQGPFFQFLDQSLLSLDPPDHARLRSLVNKAFTRRVVDSLRPRVTEIVNELLDRVQNAGRMDLIGDFAYPLPVIVIAEMLGVPAEDRMRFKAWSDDLGAALDPLAAPEIVRRADQAVLALRAYFHPLFEARRREPREDLLSGLVAAEEAGERMNTEELYATCILLLGAGNETTTNLIGNGMLALLRHPDQFDLLRDDPALITTAVEEMLRYDAPVQLTSRVATEDLEIGGKPVRAGQMVTVALGAANRDPLQFANPSAFDITRPDSHQAAFGHGIHFCLGAPLARLEAQAALPILLERMPRMALVEGEPAWRKTMVLRGLRRLPVSF
ncbi:MAG: cytochrome P450 [Dehalococcoidia bacterium]